MVRNNASAVGQTVTLKSGASFEVIDHNGKSGNHSRHLIHCRECAKDPELFGDGNFWSRLHNLTHKNAPPCGCAVHPNWTEKQNRVRCERAAKELGLQFIGWAGEHKGWSTKVILFCPDHGEIKSNSINNLVHNRSGCRKCYENRIRERAMTDAEASEKYLSACGYAEGSTLRRLSAVNDRGRRNTFEVYCPVCATDEFAQAGLCDGRFVTNDAALCSGEKSCRCGRTKKKPEKIARFQCESLLEDSGVSFVSWLSGYRNTQSKIVASCPVHGYFYPSVFTVLRGSRCPGCSAGGYSTNKAGVLYLLESECRSMMKVGISNNFEHREKDLRNSTPFGFTVLSVKTMQGPAAPVLEREILRRSHRMGLSGFNGASEWIERDESIIGYFSG